MWALIESEQRCCLDLAGIGAAVPDWMLNGTYIGTDDVLGNECTHWENVEFFIAPSNFYRFTNIGA
jgi:hypothetical protein